MHGGTRRLPLSEQRRDLGSIYIDDAELFAGRLLKATIIWESIWLRNSVAHVLPVRSAEVWMIDIERSSRSTCRGHAEEEEGGEEVEERKKRQGCHCLPLWDWRGVPFT
jgi:hypothetical protein